jgi:hypothetical protein
MGVLAESCGKMERTYFFHSRVDRRGVELIAVVLQRRLEATGGLEPDGIRGSRWRGLASFAFALFRRRLVAPTPPRLRPDFDEMRAWTSTSNFGQPTEVCYSAERRVVRVARQEFTLPSDARTLVVLMDEMAGEPRTVRVETTVIDVSPLPEFDRAHSGKTERGRARVEWMRARQQAWAAAIDGDETVQRFLTPTQAADATPTGRHAAP